MRTIEQQETEAILAMFARIVELEQELIIANARIEELETVLRSPVKCIVT